MRENCPFWHFFTFHGRSLWNMRGMEGIRHWNRREYCCEYFEWSIAGFGWIFVELWPFLSLFLVKSWCTQGNFFILHVKLILFWYHRTQNSWFSRNKSFIHEKRLSIHDFGEAENFLTTCTKAKKSKNLSSLFIYF